MSDDVSMVDPAAPADAGVAASVTPPLDPAVTPEAPVEVDPLPDPLPEPLVAPADLSADDAYEAVEAIEAAHNQAADPRENHTVGLLHSDSIFRPAPKRGIEGQRYEQVLTSL